MPKIPQYFATGKLTPSDVGFQGFETAARRIGTSAEQTATGERQLGQDIAKLWDIAGRVEGEKFATGGGAGVRGGGGRVDRSLIGTGAGGDTNFNARANASNEAEENKAFNARAHREISRAAPALANAATAVSTSISPTPTANSPSVIRGDKPPTAPPTADQIAAGDLTNQGTSAILRPGQAPQVTSYPVPRGAVVQTPTGFVDRALPPGSIQAEVLPGSVGPSTPYSRLPNALGAGPGVMPGELPKPDKVPIETTVSPAIADTNYNGATADRPAVQQVVQNADATAASQNYTTTSGPVVMQQQVGRDTAGFINSSYTAPQDSPGAGVWGAITGAVSDAVASQDDSGYTGPE